MSTPSQESSQVPLEDVSQISMFNLSNEILQESLQESLQVIADDMSFELSHEPSQQSQILSSKPHQEYVLVPLQDLSEIPIVQIISAGDFATVVTSCIKQYPFQSSQETLQLLLLQSSSSNHCEELLQEPEVQFLSIVAAMDREGNVDQNRSTGVQHRNDTGHDGKHKLAMGSRGVSERQHNSKWTCQDINQDSSTTRNSSSSHKKVPSAGKMSFRNIHTM